MTFKVRESILMLKKAKKLDKIGGTLITLLRIPILRPNRQYKASTAKMA